MSGELPLFVSWSAIDTQTIHSQGDWARIFHVPSAIGSRRKTMQRIFGVEVGFTALVKCKARGSSIGSVLARYLGWMDPARSGGRAKY